MFFLSGKGCSEFPKRMLISIGILRTDEEIEILKKYGNDVPPGLLDRSKIAIRSKLQKLKEQGYTDGIKRV